MAAGLFIAAFHFMRLRHDNQDQKTLQEAIRADSPIATELFEQLRDRPRRGGQPPGLVLIALAVAILGSGIIQGGEQNIRSAASAALFPALIGIVVYGRSILKRRGG